MSKGWSLVSKGQSLVSGGQSLVSGGQSLNVKAQSFCVSVSTRLDWGEGPKSRLVWWFHFQAQIKTGAGTGLATNKIRAFEIKTGTGTGLATNKIRAFARFIAIPRQLAHIGMSDSSRSRDNWTLFGMSEQGCSIWARSVFVNKKSYDPPLRRSIERVRWIWEHSSTRAFVHERVRLREIIRQDKEARPTPPLRRSIEQKKSKETARWHGLFHWSDNSSWGSTADSAAGNIDQGEARHEKHADTREAPSASYSAGPDTSAGQKTMGI